MSRSTRVAQFALAFIGVVCVMIALSVYAPSDEPFESDAQAMIASFGAGFGLLVVALAVFGLGSGARWAWAALWVVPVFLVSHVLLFGAFVEVVLAAIAVAALLATRPVAAVTSRESELASAH